jgi:hypothetical protein
LSSAETNKEALARTLARNQGVQSGLIAVLTAVEPCWSYSVRGDHQTKKIHLVLETRQGLPRYHYYQHPDWPKVLNALLAQAHPLPTEISRPFPQPYYWSAAQTEYATEVLLRDAPTLAQGYRAFLHQGISTFRSADVLRFLGHFVPASGRVPQRFRGEVPPRLKARPEGVRLRHTVNGNSLKVYDKQGSVLRVETTVVEFLGVVQAAHLSFLDGQQLDALAAPSMRGDKRMAGVDLQKPRMRAVAEAVVALAAQSEGFTSEQLARQVRERQGRPMAGYRHRQAAYDLRKLRSKSLVERLPKSRRYRVRRPGIRTLAGLLILREKVLKPVLAGVYRPKRGRPPKNIHPLDVHYQHLQREMLATLQTLKLAA